MRRGERGQRRRAARGASCRIDFAAITPFSPLPHCRAEQASFHFPSHATPLIRFSPPRPPLPPPDFRHFFMLSSTLAAIFIFISTLRRHFPIFSPFFTARQPMRQMPSAICCAPKMRRATIWRASAAPRRRGGADEAARISRCRGADGATRYAHDAARFEP